MRANRAYRLVVRRGGHGPALLAGPERRDLVEVVELDSAEVALLWELAPRDAKRLERALRADLAQLDATQFMARWRRYG